VCSRAPEAGPRFAYNPDGSFVGADGRVRAADPPRAAEPQRGGGGGGGGGGGARDGEEEEERGEGGGAGAAEADEASLVVRPAGQVCRARARVVVPRRACSRCGRWTAKRFPRRNVSASTQTARARVLPRRT